MLYCILRRIFILLLFLLFWTGNLFADDYWSDGGALASTPVSIALYPLNSSGAPAASVPEGIGPVIQAAIQNSSIITANITDIANVPEDPAVPPESSTTEGCAYSLTSALYYDAGNQETQAQVWLWDNSNENLIVTDQAVYTSLAEAQEFLPFLIESVFDRITKFDITLSTSGSGAMVSLDDKEMQKETEPVSIRHYGNGSITLNVTPPEKAKLSAWTVGYIDKEGNTQEDSYNDPILSLTLDTSKYSPQEATSEDAFGTIVPLTVRAVFDDSDEVKVNESTADKINLFKLAVGYRPTLFLAGDANPPFGSGLNGLGIYLQFDWVPFQEKWGNVGFGLNVGYSYFQSELGQTVYHQPVVLSPALRVSYESPLLAGFLTIGGGLGFGILVRSPEIQISGDIVTNGFEDGEPWHRGYYLPAGIKFGFRISKLIWINLAVDFDYYFAPDNYADLSFMTGVEFRF
jgi:hypothetical protein